ncbi:MAG TPA: chitobiase/beta-hexosaminidase C-terminal domain-containing protein, partial [Candidatus Cloacimonadota bacterium]|nr:chitobiase/beta-hexosaminidase C-terminal domain-containing protein [Candidatus Cloacimonadota bacterium]
THDNLGTHVYNPGGSVTEAPTFDPPAGNYMSPINVTLSSTTDNAVIRYTTDGSTPSTTEGTIYSTPIPISTSTTIRAIAYAPGYDPSFVSTAAYVLPTQISDIATLRTQATGSALYTLTGEAILTYQNTTRNVKYIQDATAAIVIDDPTGIITSTYNLYDGITGITGTLGVHASLLQFTPVADPGAATSANNVIVPETRTLDSLTSADQGKLIKVMNVTITGAATFPATASNLTATDPTATRTLRTFVGTDYANTPIPTDPVNLICLVGQFNTGMQVSPRFLSDIQAIGGELDAPIVTIVQNGANVELSWNAIAGASSYRVESSDNPYAGFTLV